MARSTRRELPWRAPVASLNVLLTSTCWRNDHNGFSHQGPGLIDIVLSRSAAVARIYLPPDANCLLSVADHCFRSRDYVNLIVIDKQPQLQWLDMDAARRALRPRRRGSGSGPATRRRRRSRRRAGVARATSRRMETVAAAWLLRRARARPARPRRQRGRPDDGCSRADRHPHGMDRLDVRRLFTADRDVVFAFHGYAARDPPAAPRATPRPERFHVRGFHEEGTTTTPFDMVVLNEMSRYHLVLEALRRARRRRPARATRSCTHCDADAGRATSCTSREHLEDMPEVRDWVLDRLERPRTESVLVVERRARRR